MLNCQSIWKMMNKKSIIVIKWFRKKSQFELLFIQQITVVLSIELVDSDLSMGHYIIRWLFILVENLFRRLGNMNMSSLSLFLKLVSNHHIRPVYVVPHDLSTDYSPNHFTSVNPYPHIQLRKVVFLSHRMNVLDHSQTHINHIFCLL